MTIQQFQSRTEIRATRPRGAGNSFSSFFYSETATAGRFQPYISNHLANAQSCVKFATKRHSRSFQAFCVVKEFSSARQDMVRRYVQNGQASTPVVRRWNCSREMSEETMTRPSYLRVKFKGRNFVSALVSVIARGLSLPKGERFNLRVFRGGSARKKLTCTSLHD
jgi:hypothetical protein